MTGTAREFPDWQGSGRPGLAIVTLQDLQALIRLVESFGFHLLQLDIRQESTVHTRTVAALLQQIDPDFDYVSASEADRLQRLAAWIGHIDPIEVNDAALDDEARVAENVAFALQCLGEKMAGSEDDAGATPLSPHLMSVIGHLLSRADKEDRNDRNLRTACYAAIMTIVENTGSADGPLLMQLLVEAGRRLEGAFSRPPPSNADEKEEVQSLVVQTAALVQTLAIALDEAVRS